MPVILSVASVVGGAGGAEAVDGRAAHVGAAGGKLLLLLLLLLGWEAGRSDALTWRRDGLGFNVDIMAGVDGEI